jgi:hypothetical protein
MINLFTALIRFIFALILTIISVVLIVPYFKQELYFFSVAFSLTTIIGGYISFILFLELKDLILGRK